MKRAHTNKIREKQRMTKRLLYMVTINESMSSWINGSMYQSINQAINHSKNTSFNAVEEAFEQSVKQWLNQATNQPINQWSNLSSKSTNQSIKLPVIKARIARRPPPRQIPNSRLLLSLQTICFKVVFKGQKNTKPPKSQPRGINRGRRQRA